MTFKRLFIFFILVIIYGLFIEDIYASFIQTGGSARPGALNGAGLAMVNDSDAIFINPAGLSRARGMDIAVARSFLFDELGIVKNSFSTVIPLAFLNFGFGWLNFDADIYSENSFFISGAKKINRIWDIGFTYKLLWQKIDLEEMATENLKSSMIGHGLDLGMICRINKDLLLGLCGKNILTSDLGRKDAEYVERIITFGLGYQYNKRKIVFNYINFLGELSYYEDQQNYFNPKVAMEAACVWKRISLLLRTGIDLYNITLGGGINFLKIDIDYAYQYKFNMEDIGHSHTISLKYRGF
ncbi:MAG: hypothetical protein JW827_00465 [Spirochaetes bacterium]|nr:hypothetical protein [Spirochaetota bacterium]